MEIKLSSSRSDSAGSSVTSAVAEVINALCCEVDRSIPSVLEPNVVDLSMSYDPSIECCDANDRAESTRVIEPEDDKALMITGNVRQQGPTAEELYSSLCSAAPSSAIHEDATIASVFPDIFVDTRFFLIKSHNHENVAIAKEKSVWSTPPMNEAKLNRAFHESKNVILIFSVVESGRFQGVARMMNEARHDLGRVDWVLPRSLSSRAFTGLIPLHWISRHELPFCQTLALQNAWNENRPVKIGRDGQEIDPKCGEALCRLFPCDDGCQLPDASFYSPGSDHLPLSFEYSRRRGGSKRRLDESNRSDGRYSRVFQQNSASDISADIQDSWDDASPSRRANCDLGSAPFVGIPTERADVNMRFAVFVKETQQILEMRENQRQINSATGQNLPLPTISTERLEEILGVPLTTINGSYDQYLLKVEDTIAKNRKSEKDPARSQQWESNESGRRLSSSQIDAEYERNVQQFLERTRLLSKRREEDIPLAAPPDCKRPRADEGNTR